MRRSFERLRSRSEACSRVDVGAREGLSFLGERGVFRLAAICALAALGL
jgi:hypothetical protein